MRSGVSVFVVLTVWLALGHQATAQSVVAMIEGEWSCEIRGSTPYYLCFKDPDQVEMCRFDENGEKDEKYTRGVWRIDDDVEWNEDDQPVVIVLVKWQVASNGHKHENPVEQPVTFTFVDDDHAQVQWGKEEIRSWTRIPEKDDD